MRHICYVSDAVLGHMNGDKVCVCVCVIHLTKTSDAEV